MGEFDIHHIELEVLLYQAGYLTIKDSQEIASRTFYSLSVPNKEVSIGFNDYLVRMFFANGTDTTAARKLSKKYSGYYLQINQNCWKKLFLLFCRYSLQVVCKKQYC